MDRETRFALIQRALALQHKMKVHDTMPRPDNHEEVARSRLARWDLEDELRAIEEILSADRARDVEARKRAILSEGLPKKKPKK